MARSSSDSSFKKNNKLESFLKRTLAEDVFERVRTYETCIIVSEKEKKAFKYVVLDDEWIYLTENPPKNIQKAVHLGDVVSVRLVNDFPEFLSGEEQENTQHIAITYLTSKPKRGSKNRSKKSSKNGSISEMEFANSSSPGIAFSQDYAEDNATPRSGQGVDLGRPSSRNSPLFGAKYKSPKNRLERGLSESLDENLLKSLKDNDNSDDSDNGRLSRSASERENKKSLGSSRQDGLHSFHNVELSGRNSPRNSYSPRNGTSDKENGTGKASCPCTTVGCARGKRHSIDDTVPLLKSNGANTQNDDVPKITVNGVSHSSGGLETDRSPMCSSRSSTSTVDTDRSKSSAGLLSENGTFLPKREAVLNIYLLNLTSSLMMLIRCAWNNYLIRATLLLDPTVDTLNNTSSKQMNGTSKANPNTKRNGAISVHEAGSSDKMALLYDQLKQELLNPSNIMVDVFSLFNELRTATEKNCALKKLFWKNSDLFVFLVRQLQRYLPRSPVAINTDKGRLVRADEFELVILLTDILSMMFRETEIVPQRSSVLRMERGRFVSDLLEVLTCIPEIPKKHVRPSTRAAALLNSAKFDLEREAADVEMSKLVTEFTQAAVMTMFELFLVARQPNWGNTDGNFLNIGWMVQLLEDLQTTDNFVSKLIQSAMAFTSRCQIDPLHADEVVTLYHQFSILNTFLDYSPRVTTYIQTNFMEEFKYFVQVPVIEHKLPFHCPLNSEILTLVGEVMSKVVSSSKHKSSFKKHL